jgi:hypothetical protein
MKMPAKVFAQRIAPYGLDRPVGFVGMIVLAPSSGQAHIDPVSGLIGDTFEFLSIDKSLQKVDRMAVKVLPR